MTKVKIYKNKVVGSKYYSYKMTFPKQIAQADGFGDTTEVEVLRYGDSYVIKRV